MKAMQSSLSVGLFLFMVSTVPAVLLSAQPGLAETVQVQHEEFTAAITKSTLRAIEARKYPSPYPPQLLKIAQSDDKNGGGGGANNDHLQSRVKA